MADNYLESKFEEMRNPSKSKTIILFIRCPLFEVFDPDTYSNK